MHHYNMDLDTASGHVVAPNSFTMEFCFVKLSHLYHGSLIAWFIPMNPKHGLIKGLHCMNLQVISNCYNA